MIHEQSDKDEEQGHVLAAVGHSCHPLFFVGTLLPLCTIKNRWKSIDTWRWEGITCKRIFRKIIMGHVSNTH